MVDPSCDDLEPRDAHPGTSVERIARNSEPELEGDRPSFSGAREERTSDAPERTSNPGAGVARKPRRRPERDDLEQRLAAIAEDVRVKAEEADRQRREQTVLEARVHVEGVKPIESNAPDRIVGAKVVLAPGLDPRQDPTLVGRRKAHDEWEFGVVGDALGGERTLQSAPDESMAGERKSSSSVASDERRGGRRIVAGVLGGAIAAVLLVLILQSRRMPSSAEHARTPAAPALPKEDAPATVAHVEEPAPVPGKLEVAIPSAQEDAGAEGSRTSIPASVSAWKAAPRRTTPQENGTKVARPDTGRSRAGTGPIGKDPEY